MSVKRKHTKYSQLIPPTSTGQYHKTKKRKRYGSFGAIHGEIKKELVKKGD